jgi:hypothetical protein
VSDSPTYTLTVQYETVKASKKTEIVVSLRCSVAERFRISRPDTSGRGMASDEQAVWRLVGCADANGEIARPTVAASSMFWKYMAWKCRILNCITGWTIQTTAAVPSSYKSCCLAKGSCELLIRPIVMVGQCFQLSSV